VDESAGAFRNKAATTTRIFERVVRNYLFRKTHIDPAILPPVPVSTARCTPDNTGGSNRRAS
jgi:hypothetical protein